MKKGQSAVEYLSTYLWAILIIALIFILLYALGLFTSFTQGPRAQPGSCSVKRTGVGPATLSGLCTGLAPEFIGKFSNPAGSKGGGQACINTTISSLNTTHGNFTTVNFWMNWNGTINETPLGFPGYFIWISTPNECIGVSTGNNDDYGVAANSLANKWAMVTEEFYSGPFATNSILYINGKLQNSFQCQGTVHTGTTKNVVLIVSSTGSKYRFTGAMSNVQVYNTSLDSNTVLAMYIAGIGGAPIDLNHLAAWFPLNGNSNDYGGTPNLVFAKCTYDYLGTYTAPIT